MIFTDYIGFLFHENVTLDIITGIKIKTSPKQLERERKRQIDKQTDRQTDRQTETELLSDFSFESTILLFLNFIVDGNFSQWSNWTSCSVSCSQGARTRERTCTNPSPVNGTNCTGNYTDWIVCKEGPCPGITKFFGIVKPYFSNSSLFLSF